MFIGSVSMMATTASGNPPGSTTTVPCIEVWISQW